MYSVRASSSPHASLRALGQTQQAELLAVRREHPDAARTTDVEVAGDVDLEAVDRVLARLVGEIAQELTGAGVCVVAHDRSVLEIPVADVEPAFVRGEGKAV